MTFGCQGSFVVKGEVMLRRISGLVATVGLLALLGGCVSIRGFMELEEVTVKESPRWFEPNSIALIDVDGFLSSTESPWFMLFGTSVADVREKLERAANDWSVKAVVLRINSPGGEVAASDMIHEEIIRFKKKTKKPVVAALMNLAASGGYYVAVAADRIIANRTSVTGSVGVIMEFPNLEGLYNTIGIRWEVIKSGDKKDIASTARKMTDEERKLLQSINQEMFDRFVQVVRDGRPGMREQDIEKIKDGQVVTAKQALELNMVDSIGYLDEAIEEAKRMAGISYADVIMYRPFPRYNTNVYAKAKTEPKLVEEALKALLKRHGASFLYLWTPGL